MKARGFTLVETLVALAILSIVSMSLMLSFVAQVDANTRSEQRAEAAAVAKQVLEFLRMEDPELMPASGVLGPQQVNMNDRQYEVLTHYCTKPEYCDQFVRHLRVEVRLGGVEIFDVETIFTQLR